MAKTKDRENQATLEEIIEATALEAIKTGKVIFPFDENSYWLFRDTIENVLFLANYSSTESQKHSRQPHRRLGEAVARILGQKKDYSEQLILESVETWSKQDGTVFQGLILHRRDMVDIKKRQLPLTGFSTVIKK